MQSNADILVLSVIQPVASQAIGKVVQSPAFEGLVEKAVHEYVIRLYDVSTLSAQKIGTLTFAISVAMSIKEELQEYSLLQNQIEAPVKIWIRQLIIGSLKLKLNHRL